MKLSKRETTLLIVLIVLLLVVGSSYLLIMPLMDKIEQAKTEHSDLDLLAAQIELAFSDTRTGEVLDQQLEEAKAGYNVFYGTINSYNIDSILRGLLTDNGLNVSMMNISDYENVALPNQEGDEGNSDPPEVNLMRSTVELAINGSYEGMLNFLDELNSKSFGISAETVTIRLAQGITAREPETSQPPIEPEESTKKSKKSKATPTPVPTPAPLMADAVFRIYIYGIEQPQGVTLE